MKLLADIHNHTLPESIISMKFKSNKDNFWTHSELYPVSFSSSCLQTAPHYDVWSESSL